MTYLAVLLSDLAELKLFQENYTVHFEKMLWTRSATLFALCVSFHKSQLNLLKRNTKKPLHRYRKQGGVPKAKLAKLIFDALMQRLLHLFYLIHQITNYVTPYYEDSRYSVFAPF